MQTEMNSVPPILIRYAIWNKPFGDESAQVTMPFGY